MRLNQRLMFSLMSLFTPKLKIELLKLQSKIQSVSSYPRPFTIMLKDHFGDAELTGCEIGFGFGKNTENILSLLHIEKLYIIEPYFGKSYWEGNRFIDLYKNYKPSPSLALNEAAGTLEFICKTSDEAFKTLPKNINFIYINGNHSFDYCLRDITNAMEHVKIGGFVGGHDFTFAVENETISVMEAVLHYAARSGITPTLKFPDYWFRKEEK